MAAYFDWFAQRQAEEQRYYKDASIKALYIKGADFEKAGQDELALRCYLDAAQQGHVEAKFRAGACFGKKGTAEDDATSFRWYKEAAEQGSAGGQLMLGIYYKNGKVVQQDYAKAVEWFRKSAEQKGDGHPYSQRSLYQLGNCYKDGLGVPRDHEKAAEFYYKAAMAGSSDGQKELENLRHESRITEFFYQAFVEKNFFAVGDLRELKREGKI